MNTGAANTVFGLTCYSLSSKQSSDALLSSLVAHSNVHIQVSFENIYAVLNSYQA